MSRAKGKGNRWRSEAQLEIEKALRKRSSPQPNGRREQQNRSVARQLFELRVRQERVEGESRKRAREREAQRREEQKQTEFQLAKERLLTSRNHAKKDESRNDIPTLFSLCAKKLVQLVAYDVTPEESDIIAMFPWDIKIALLEQSKAIAREENHPVLSDELLRGLIDVDAPQLDLSFSGISDAFVELLQPATDTSTQVVSSWEVLDTSFYHPRRSLLRSLDLSFCPNLTEESLSLLAEVCPALEELSIAGNFNQNESGVLAVQYLTRFENLVSLDLACCQWVSVELLFLAGFFDVDELTKCKTLRVINVEECPHMSTPMRVLPVRHKHSDPEEGNIASRLVFGELRDQMTGFRLMRALEFFESVQDLRWTMIVMCANVRKAVRFVTSYRDQYLAT